MVNYSFLMFGTPKKKKISENFQGTAEQIVNLICEYKGEIAHTLYY